MEFFNVLQPSPVLLPYIKHYWTLKISDAPAIRERVIASGSMTLVFHRGNRMFSSVEDDLQPRSFICGLSSKYTDLLSSDQLDMIVVVFRPFGLKAFFDAPACEFQDRCVSINDLGDKYLIELEDKLFYEQDDDICIKLIEEYLIKRLCFSSDYDYKRILASVRLINSQPLVTIGSLADVTCLSQKQFFRVFSNNVGTKPKEFIRIVRFQRALYVLQNRADISMTELAYECGYYDQPHLIKEFKYFSGYTPREYIAVCAPYSDYFS